MLRRSLLAIPAIALLPEKLRAGGELFGKSSIAPVKAGQDREGRKRAIGLSSTTYKV